MTDQQIRQAQLNAKAQTHEDALCFGLGLIVLCRCHLVVCAILFLSAVAGKSVQESWMFGVPVTALGLPGLINFKKVKEASDKAFALEHQ